MQPVPDHFLVRPGTTDGKPGPIVPLIAVDQLPHWIQLDGVPRELDTDQTIGLTNLGIIDKEENGIYEVRLHYDMIRAILNRTGDMTPSSPPDREGRARDTNNKTRAETNTDADSGKKESQVTKQTSSLSHDVQYEDSSPGSLSSPSSTSVHEEPAAQAQGQKPPHPAERMLSASRHNIIMDTAVDATAHAGKPIRPHMTQAMHDRPYPTAFQRSSSSSIVITDKPQAHNGSTGALFCRHWCHHGTCKFGWDCRYQHRMPTTPEGLREVGLRDFPTWYLLVMAGGGFPGHGIDALAGALGMDSSYDPPGPSTAAMPPARYLSTPDAQAHPDVLISHQPPAARHPSPMDLRLMRGRVSALLASPDAVSSRQKLRQVREMREILLLRGSGGRPHTNTHAYANLHTNASVAANAAVIQRQAEWQQLGRQRHDLLSDLPVSTRAARARAAVDISDDLDEVRPEDSVSRGMGNSVGSVVDGERLTVVGGGNQDGQLLMGSAAPMPEEKLVDID